MENPAQNLKVTSPQNPIPSSAPPATNPTPGEPNQTPPVTKPSAPNFFEKNKKKLIIAGSIALVLLILSILGIAAKERIIALVVEPTPTPTPTPIIPTPTPDPTKDWRIFGNEKYGLQFQYPHEFTYTSTTELPANYNNSEIVDFRNFNRVNRYTNPNATWIVVESSFIETGVTDLTTWIKGHSAIPIRNENQTFIKEFSVVTFETGDGKTINNTAFYKEGRFVVFSLLPTAETGGSYKDSAKAVEYYNNILRSFIFTDLTFLPISTNIELKLPAGWKISEETRDRMTVSDSKNIKSINFHKLFKKTSKELEDLAKAKIISQLQNQNIKIEGRNVREYFGCRGTGICELIYVTVLYDGTYSYMIEYVNKDKDPIYHEIIEGMKFLR